MVGKISNITDGPTSCGTPSHSANTNRYAQIIHTMPITDAICKKVAFEHKTTELKLYLLLHSAKCQQRKAGEIALLSIRKGNFPGVHCIDDVWVGKI